MNVKDYIQRYKNAVVKLEIAKQELERIEAKIDNVSIDLSGMPKATSHATKTERYVIELLKAREEYVEAETHYESVRKEMIKLIFMITDEMSVKILNMRIVKDKSWQDIAREVHYSVYYVSKDLYRKALHELQKFC